MTHAANDPVPIRPALLRIADARRFRYSDRDRELFDTSLRDFVPPNAFDAHAHLYDLRHLASDTQPDEFAGSPQIDHEVLLDCITQVTETTNRFSGLPLGGRAVQIPDGRTPNYFLTTFGRAPRETPCSCEVNREANLSQALHLVNGETITLKIAQGKLIAVLLAEKKSPEQVIEELYVRTLCRKPTEGETKKLVEIIRRETTDAERVKELAKLQQGIDPQFTRTEERIKTIKSDLAKLKKDSKEAVALEKQIKTIEQTLVATRQRYEANATQTIYGDILWGLFNSTEFTFNH